ncbi:MAG: laccase domain-containing protein [Bacteroidota bacterium]
MRTHLIGAEGLKTFISSKQCDVDCTLSRLDIDYLPRAQAGEQASEIVEITTPESVEHPSAGALITREKNVVLMLKTNAGMPILLYRENPRLCAVVFVASPGKAKEVFTKTLEKINAIDPISEPLHVWFGPSTCRFCHADRSEGESYDLMGEAITEIKTLGFPYRMYRDTRCMVCDNQELYSKHLDDENQEVVAGLVMV